MSCRRNESRNRLIGPLLWLLLSLNSCLLNIHLSSLISAGRDRWIKTGKMGNTGEREAREPPSASSPSSLPPLLVSESLRRRVVISTVVLLRCWCTPRSWQLSSRFRLRSASAASGSWPSRPHRLPCRLRGGPGTAYLPRGLHPSTCSIVVWIRSQGDDRISISSTGTREYFLSKIVSG